jgi:hypothetical protein
LNFKLEQIKGYIKAFAAINDGNNEGPDYLVDEIENNGNELIAIENYLMEIYNKVPDSLLFEKVENWQETFDILFELYFERNIKFHSNLYKTEFTNMLIKYIDNRQFEVFCSGIKSCYSCITEFFNEVSGSDMLFVFNKKVLIFHFGINN